MINDDSCLEKRNWFCNTEYTLNIIKILVISMYIFYILKVTMIHKDKTYNVSKFQNLEFE